MCSASWMSSTSDVYDEFWEYPGKTKSPLMRIFTEPVSHPCTSYDGLDMYIGWRMAAFQMETRTVIQPQKGGTRPQSNLLKDTQEKERFLVIKCTSNWLLCFYLPRLQPPLQVTHRTVQPHRKKLICQLHGCYHHSLTRLMNANDSWMLFL